VDGDCISVPYELADSGTITFWCQIHDWSFNYMYLMGTSSSAPHMYDYTTGKLRCRLNSSVNADMMLDKEGWNHIAFCWFRGVGTENASVAIYRNGEYVYGADGTWSDPGETFYFGGGRETFDRFAIASYDDFRIYDEVLTADQIAELAQLAPDIPGDANGDGKVNKDDAEALAANWGTTSGATWAMGDFDGDGDVDAGDASILAANWGHGTEQSGASIPEPSTFALLLGLPLLALWRRRK